MANHAEDDRAAFQPRRRWRRILALSLVLFIGWDYVQYHRRLDHAMDIVRQLDGKAGSLLDWPLGREIIISFHRPLSDDELTRLKPLTTLTARHAVYIAFVEDITEERLQAARAAFPGIPVTHWKDGE